MRNSYTLQEWGNQGSRINYDPPQKVLRCRKRTFPCSLHVHGRHGRLPTFHVSETTAVAAASRIRCSRRRDSRQTQCETWEKCAEFAVVPPPLAGRTGRTSFASLGVVSDRFSSLTRRRRPRRFHRRRRRRRCQSRLGIRQAGAAAFVRPVFFTGFKDGRKRPGMGITTEKYPGSPSFLLPGRSCCFACH